MPRIELSHINKIWGNFYGVEDLNMVIEDNAFVTLLGPSGCGKTTTLRMIAGLETPTSGRIVIGDEVVFDSEEGINVPANKRHVGFLFQNYALWPNMTVYQNISFGLTNIKELMSVKSTDVMVLRQLVHVYEDIKKATELVNECLDKNGEVDETRAVIKLIDYYTVSIFTAKKIYKTVKANSVEADLAKVKAELEATEAKLLAKGITVNADGEQEVLGEVVKAVRKLDKEEIDLMVRRVSRIVKVQMFMDRYPAELSGGQQQRVAIARTLAPGPKVLFMDEPLSNLDAKLRLEMRYELQRLHVETGSTFVYVTHDQMEAMTLATRICLINNGVLQQYEPPLDVYNKPCNTFTADFVGNPSINFVEASGDPSAVDSVDVTLFDNVKATFTPNSVHKLADWFSDRDRKADEAKEELLAKLADPKYVEKGNKDEVFKYHIQKVDEGDETLQKDYTPVNGDFVVGIRPEFFEICDDGKIEGTIYGAMPTGMETTLKIKIGEYLVTSVSFGNKVFQIGSKVRVNFSKSHILLFDRVSGKLIDDGSLEIK